MGVHHPCVHYIQDAIAVLDGSDANEQGLPHQALQLFKRQVQASLSARLKADLQQHAVDKILHHVDATLEEEGLFSRFSHAVHCGGAYTARAVLQKCLLALQDNEHAEDAGKVNLAAACIPCRWGAGL